MHEKMGLQPLDWLESEIEEELNAKAHLNCNDVIKIEPMGWVRRQDLLSIFEYRDQILLKKGGENNG